MLSKKYAALDNLFSRYIRTQTIREYGGCARCLTPKHDVYKEDGTKYPAWKQLQTAHFWGRRNTNVRFDPDNAIGLCGACHLYFHAHPLEFVEFFKARLGEQAFDLLRARANEVGRPDKKAIELWLKKELKEMGA